MKKVFFAMLSVAIAVLIVSYAIVMSKANAEARASIPAPMAARSLNAGESFAMELSDIDSRVVMYHIRTSFGQNIPFSKTFSKALLVKVGLSSHLYLSDSEPSIEVVGKFDAAVLYRFTWKTQAVHFVCYRRNDGQWYTNVSTVLREDFADDRPIFKTMDVSQLALLSE